MSLLGCSWVTKNGDMEEDRPHPPAVICRRCDEPTEKDEIVEGLCLDCRINAGLTICAGCGRTVPVEAVRLCASGPGGPYCPTCKKENDKEDLLRQQVRAGTHRLDGSEIFPEESGKPDPFNP